MLNLSKILTYWHAKVSCLTYPHIDFSFFSIEYRDESDLAE